MIITPVIPWLSNSSAASKASFRVALVHESEIDLDEVRLCLGHVGLVYAHSDRARIFGWFAYVNEQLAHQQPVKIGDYTVQMMRDTLENWQSEFLQLLWQVAGLAILLHVGSPQSKEGDDRMEAKIDAILLAVEPKKGDKLLKEIDDEYEGRHTDARFVRMLQHGHRRSAAHEAANQQG
jgi:hypothetical protein